MISPIKKISVVDQAIERIYELISTNKLRIGDRLPGERELSEALNISRNSLREAIRVLDIMGIICVVPGNGMTLGIPKLNTTILGSLRYLLLQDEEKLLELYETRRILEVECTALAAEKATDEDIKNLWTLFYDLEEHRDDRRYAIDKEINLHNYVAVISGNSILEEMLLSIKGLLRESRESTVPRMGVTDQTIEDQRKILQSITDHNVEKAKVSMMEHINNIYTR